MNFNPANWAVVNALQGQQNNTGQTFSSSMSNAYGGTSPSYSSTAGESTAPSSGGQTLGATNYGTPTTEGSPNPDSTSWYSGGGGTGGTGGTTPTVDVNADDRLYLNQQNDLYTQLLNTLRGTTTRQGNEKIDSSYNTAGNKARLDRSRDVENQDFQQRTSNEDKTSALGKVDTNARTLNNSLSRILGLAGGRSSAQSVAGNAVARQASGERSGVLEDYGRNQFQLDKRRDESAVDFQSILQELLASKNTAQQDFQTGLGEEELRLNSGQSQIAAQLAGLNGTSQFAATQPYFQQSQEIDSRMNALPDQFANNVSARDYQAKPVNLRDYVVDRAAINANRGNTSQGQSTYSPYAQFLKRDEEQRIV